MFRLSGFIVTEEKSFFAGAVRHRIRVQIRCGPRRKQSIRKSLSSFVVASCTFFGVTVILLAGD
jgi:hypothetical protein